MTDRIPWGEEIDDKPWYLSRDADSPCPDCAAEVGNLHARGCDVEQCPVCHTQLISCEHGKAILDKRTELETLREDVGDQDR